MRKSKIRSVKSVEAEQKAVLDTALAAATAAPAEVITSTQYVAPATPTHASTLKALADANQPEATNARNVEFIKSQAQVAAANGAYAMQFDLGATTDKARLGSSLIELGFEIEFKPATDDAQAKLLVKWEK